MKASSNTQDLRNRGNGHDFMRHYKLINPSWTNNSHLKEFNMTDIKSFDQFLADLSNNLRQYPDRKSQLIMEAIRQTQCPYLKERIWRCGDTEILPAQKIIH